MRARTHLGREIGVVICAKLILLAALYVFFFSDRAPNDPAATAGHVIGER